MSTPQNRLIVPGPETAPPQPIPGELADRLDQLPIDDGEIFWLVARLVEYSHRLGYADGHARGYRDRDRETVADKIAHRGVESTQGIRPVPKAQ